jgi:DnaJ-class molecular chaperone
MSLITIIEKKADYTVVECARCSGSGREEYQDWKLYQKEKTCETCSGNGMVKVSQTPPFYECENCGGSGSEGKRNYDTCSVCEGIGIKSIDELESY